MWIYCLYKKKPINIWWFSFLVSDLWILLLLCNYLVSYWKDICDYPSGRFVSLIAAAIWTFIGPVLIIRWMENFYRLTSSIDTIFPFSKRGGKIVDQELSIKNKIGYNVFGVLWASVIVLILILPHGCVALEKYYFKGGSDWNYWVFLLCVFYIAYQTSCFFVFLVISRSVVKYIIQQDGLMVSLLLNEGKRNSLSMIGDFISRTAVYFCSGLLFFPIMIEFFRTSGTINPDYNTTVIIFALMGIYIVAIIVYLMTMNKYVVNKAKRVKDKVIEELMKESSKIENGSTRELTIDQRIRYVAGIDTNPIAADQYLKFLYGIIVTGLLPTVFAMILQWGSK